MLKFFLITLFIVSLAVSQQLPDSIYTFTVNKVAMGPIISGQFSPIADSSYDYPNTVITYRFEFKDNFDSLIIYGSNNVTESDTLRCVYEASLASFFFEDTPSMNYAICSGTVASGVVHILYLTNPVYTDLRIFGSGVPILRSDVGVLTAMETSIGNKTINYHKNTKLNSTKENFYLPNGRTLKKFEKKSFIGKKNSNNYIIIQQSIKS